MFDLSRPGRAAVTKRFSDFLLSQSVSRPLPLDSTADRRGFTSHVADPISSIRQKNSLTFFGTDLYQTLRQEDEPRHLDPFGHDIAHYLAPFAVDVHP
jgi:hypothetical protein